MDYFNYSRRKTSVVTVGSVPLGGKYPIRIQSMTNTSTRDTEACVEQAKRIADAGGEYVRLTTQGIKEAQNLKYIQSGLRSQNYLVPLIADIHFNPDVADVAALYADKVRINPGNYVDAARTFKHLEYSDEEYSVELNKLKNRLIPFLAICKENHTAVRIGVNHGSLSDRIMSRYGDTPEGMVESCMEFLRVCKEEGFTNVVISIKASNTVVMVRTVRLLVQVMEEEEMAFPLHLGVTEAGDGEDGRIKSALGIGALLADGLGDTIRVSLSEDPELEIPVARKLVDYVTLRESHPYIYGTPAKTFDYVSPFRRKTHEVKNIGGDQYPVVIADGKEDGENISLPFAPDYRYIGGKLPIVPETSVNYILDAGNWAGEKNAYPAFTPSQLEALESCPSELKFLFLSYGDLSNRVITCLKKHPEVVVISQSKHVNPVGEHRGLVHRLINEGLTHPVVFFQAYDEVDAENFQIKAAADMGPMVFDGFCDGIYLRSLGELPMALAEATAFGILQAGRLRMSKTEYISCPGCGRTLFDLQTTIARVKGATSHLKGLKIGIMGCIVNGPGEMADADYGYVGAGRGKVSLYKKKECIEKNIPEEEAVDKLIGLIKANGDYTPTE